MKTWNSNYFVVAWLTATVMAIVVLTIAWIDIIRGDFSSRTEQNFQPEVRRAEPGFAVHNI